MTTSITTFNPIEKELLELAVDYKKQFDGLKRDFRKIVSFIRENKMQPDRVKAVLSEAGIEDTRISEMKRVADADQETYAQYTSKALGFTATLAKVRAEKPKGSKGTSTTRRRLAFNKLFVQFNKIVTKGHGTQYFATSGKFALVILNMGDPLPDKMTAASDVCAVFKREGVTFEIKKQHTPAGDNTKGK